MKRTWVYLALLVLWLACVPVVAAQEIVLVPGLDDFPITAGMLYTMLGAVVFTALVTEWLKRYCGEWRFLNLVALVVAFAFEFVAGWITTGSVTPQMALTAFLLAFAAASLATFGYELIFNLLGKAGVGRRSEERLISEALAVADGVKDAK
jgi:peptidoglycan/LPS O-acetylase OafA/YrhL